MGNKKLEDTPRRGRKLVMCGRCVAVGSVLLLVPFVRRLREHRRERHQQHHHRRFPLLGH